MTGPIFGGVAARSCANVIMCTLRSFGFGSNGVFVQAEFKGRHVHRCEPDLVTTVRFQENDLIKLGKYHLRLKYPIWNMGVSTALLLRLCPIVKAIVGH